MTLVSEALRIKSNIANAYASAEGKGATLPDVQNSDNLAECIDSITGGGGSGGSAAKYGLNLGSILGELDENGVLQPPSEESELVFKGMVKGISGSFPIHFLEGNTNITGVHFSDLEEVEKTDERGNFLYQSLNAYNGVSKIKSVSFPKLKRVVNNIGNGFNFIVGSFDYLPELSGELAFPELEEIINAYCRGFYSAKFTKVSFPKLKRLKGMYAEIYYYDLREVTSVDFSSLEEIERSLWDSDYKIRLAYFYKLTTLSFPKLSKLQGKIKFEYAGLTNLYFNSLKSDSFGSYTNVFNNMLQGVTGCTVHFPSNLEEKLSTWSDVTAGFGGTDTIILFDLEPTE